MIVISGANIEKGGPFTIYKTFIHSISKKYPDKQIIAFVSNNIDMPFLDNVIYEKIRFYKSFFLNKLFVEYVYYYFYSLKHKVNLWISLNDCSPIVSSEKQIVYCHNAAPFYKFSFKDLVYPTRIFLQSFYYNLFYIFNLNSNDYIVVQQESFKQLFFNRYKIDPAKVLVNGCNNFTLMNSHFSQINKDKKIVFIYPTSALPHKNIEVLLRAANNLEKCSSDNFEIILTISGFENRYIKKLYSRFKHVSQIKWVGNLTTDQLLSYYNIADALIFSSKLETWGLPISEFKQFNKPIIICNEPYALETANVYSKIKYFNSDDHIGLSNILLEFINKKDLVFDEVLYSNPETEYYFESIENLLDYVFKKV